MLKGHATTCPFRYQGQYEDVETGLYYNRFWYYDPEDGQYVSQDPIRIAGGIELYSYVSDVNSWVDKLGLSGGPIVVIGEGQKAVDEATRALRAAGYNAESMMIPKNQWRGGPLTPGMPRDKFLKTVEWNKNWLKDKIKQGYKVVDIGTDGRSIPSEFYQAELEAIREMGTTKVTLKKLPNGETIKDMRKRVCS